MKAPYPKEEENRLKALYDYGMLDSEPEQDYDDLTRIASRLCDCPIALIVLIDKDRQWFKSRIGLDVMQTHRDHAFCAHAILQPSEPLIVPDATTDDRFADNPLVTGDPRIRFYAGVPLNTSEGMAIGTMCVIDRKPRSLTAEQLDLLAALGRQVMRLMDLRRVSDALARALSEAKVLEGLLPMCAHCKDIRDEAGAWQKVEAYVEQRTAAGFSHGICPTCLARHFPEIDPSASGSKRPKG